MKRGTLFFWAGLIAFVVGCFLLPRHGVPVALRLIIAGLAFMGLGAYSSSMDR